MYLICLYICSRGPSGNYLMYLQSLLHLLSLQRYECVFVCCFPHLSYHIM